jgi:hypothetical protein
MSRDWRTRPDPFAEVWPQLQELVQRNPGLEAKTLVADLQRRYRGTFADGQLRTLQRGSNAGGRSVGRPRRSSSA